MTPELDIWRILAQDAAPFIILSYIMIDATRRMERVMLAAIALMKHCNCQDCDNSQPVKAA